MNSRQRSSGVAGGPTDEATLATLVLQASVLHLASPLFLLYKHIPINTNMANKHKGKGGKSGYRKVMKSAETLTWLGAKTPNILAVWQEQTKLTGGNFIRHIDGNRQHNSIFNLTAIHPHDAFKHPEWVVDWECGLTNKQIQFVRDNMSVLADFYDKERFNSPFKGKAHICKPNMELDIVPVEQADKYKEHIDKVWQKVCAHKCNHCEKEAVFDVISPTKDSGVQRLKLCKDCCQSHKNGKKVVIDCDPDAGLLKVTKK